MDSELHRRSAEESVEARLDRIETKLDEVLAFVRLVQTDEYREKQNENDFQINVMADLFVEILEDIRDCRSGKDNGTDIRKEN